MTGQPTPTSNVGCASVLNLTCRHSHACRLTVNGNARGLGVTCYSHNGKDLYCNKPEAGTCWTTGGWCPPDFGGDDEILPTEGVSAPSLHPVTRIPCDVCTAVRIRVVCVLSAVGRLFSRRPRAPHVGLCIVLGGFGVPQRTSRVCVCKRNGRVSYFMLALHAVSVWHRARNAAPISDSPYACV